MSTPDPFADLIPPRAAQPPAPAAGDDPFADLIPAARAEDPFADLVPAPSTVPAATPLTAGPDAPTDTPPGLGVAFGPPAAAAPPDLSRLGVSPETPVAAGPVTAETPLFPETSLLGEPALRAGPADDALPAPLALAARAGAALAGREYQPLVTRAEARRAITEEGMFPRLAQYLAGNTAAGRDRRRAALGQDRDPLEAELSDLAEQAYQAGGYESPAYARVEQALSAYRQAKADPGFNLNEVLGAFQADPEALLGELTRALIADPQFLAVPAGWAKLAARAGEVAKAAGAGARVQAAARAAGGVTGTAAVGAGVTAPTVAAHQLGETGAIDLSRLGRETLLGAGLSAATVGGLIGAAQGVRALRQAIAARRAAGAPPAELAALEADVDRLIERVTTPEGEAVRPRAEALDGLPGEPPPAPEPSPLAPLPAGEGGIARPRAPHAEAVAGRAAAPSPQAPLPPRLTPEPQPGGGERLYKDKERQLAEYERLAGLAEDPGVRRELARRAELLRGEIAGQAPKLTPAERAERRRRLDPQADDLITAIRKLGGIDTGVETDFAGRLSHLPRRGFGLPAVERPGKGRTLDDLAELLHDEGYLERRDVAELYNKLDRAAAGEDLYSFRADPARVAPAPGRAGDRDWAFTEAEAARAGRDDYIINDDGAVVPSRNLTRDEFDALQEELLNAERFFEREADADVAGQPRGGDRLGVPPRVGDTAAGRGDQPAPGETAGLPGVEPRNPARQALADRQRDVDARLRGTDDVPPDAGPGDLFSARARQVDIEDEAGRPTGFKINAPETPQDDFVPGPEGGEARPGAAATGRGGSAADVGGVDVFLPRAATPGARAATRVFAGRVARVRTGTFPSAITQVRSAADVAHATAPLRKSAQEQLLTVVTDDAGNVLRIDRLGLGGRSSASVDPGLVAAAAVNTPGAQRVWFVHNHPNELATQSGADRKLTVALHELLRGSGVTPEGMVTVSAGRRFSYFHPTRAVSDDAGAAFPVERQDSTGDVEFGIPAAPRRERLPVTERQLRRFDGSGPQVMRPRDAADYLREQVGEDAEGVLLLSFQARPAAFVPLSRAEMEQLRRGAGGPLDRLLAAIDEVNPGRMVVRVNAAGDEAIRAAGNFDGFARWSGMKLLDVLDRDFESLMARGDIPDQSTFYANPFVTAAREVARDVGLHPVRNLAAGFAGGTYGATTSEAEPGSAQWWLDVAAGAAAGVTLAQFLRRTQVVGKGSIVDNARARLGDWIEGLPLIGRGPAELQALKQKQQLMRQLLDRQTEAVGRELLERFTPAERAMMADLIETRGIVKDLNLIHRQAQLLDEYLTHAGERMKALKMLPAELETGGYLHRYYAKHLGLGKLGREAKGQSLAGSWSIARGTDDVFDRSFFSPGARAIADEHEQVAKEIARLEARRGDLLDADTAGRLAELKQRKRELGKVELHEFRGYQNGRLRSFLFTGDEAGRVDTGAPAPAGMPFTKAGARVLIDQPKPSPGTVDPRAQPVAPGADKLYPTNYRWSVRGVKPKEVLLHRDWTKAERQSWGEIEDAGYRYVRGMAEVAHDLSLATLFASVAKRGDWVSDAPRTFGRFKRPWVYVPDSKVHRNSPLQKYGALAGKYVRPDVWAGIKGYGRAPFAPGRAGQVYRAALAKWKLYKTVYNPVTHLNNSYSNTEMLLMAGYSPGTLAEALGQMRKGEASAVWREARDHGLFGTDWTTSVLNTSEAGGNAALERLAEQLRTQPEVPDAALVTTLVMDAKEWWLKSRAAIAAADTKWKTGVEVARAMAAPAMAGVRFTFKPVGVAARAMQRAYKFEDELFKLAVFQAERRRGAKPEQAARTAQGYFFDYQNVPEAIKLVRDLPVGAPFISYPYFAIQAIAKNAAQRPELILALVAGYEALNYAALAGDGMSPGEYWQIESAEETVSPPWERGRALWGARNMVRLPHLEGYRLALGRAHALGNPFMTDAGGREKLPEVPGAAGVWGSSIFGGNPLHALLDVSVNEDWKGKPIYKPGAPDEEKAKAIAAYLYQAWSPSNLLVPGSYPQSRVLEGMANEAARRKREGEPEGIIAPVVAAANETAEALGLGQFTGLDRADNEILTRDALLASFGVKLRPIRVEQSVEFEASKTEREKKLLADWFRGEVRKHAEDRITDAQLDAAERKLEAGLDAADAATEEKFSAEAFLKKRLPATGGRE